MNQEERDVCIQRITEYIKTHEYGYKPVDKMDANERYLFNSINESIELTRHLSSCIERINDIYITALDEHRRLTKAEREAVADLRDEFDETKAIDDEAIVEICQMVEELWDVGLIK